MTGLTCYSCNTDGAGPGCIDEPNKYTTVECVKDDAGNIKDYCYTTRLEETDEETGDLSIHFLSPVDILGLKHYNISIMQNYDIALKSLPNYFRDYA